MAGFKKNTDTETQIDFQRDTILEEHKTEISSQADVLIRHAQRELSDEFKRYKIKLVTKQRKNTIKL